MDWLDYIEVNGQTEDGEGQEILCRAKGRGQRAQRRVPRIPLKAVIQRMMEESSSDSNRGRGRARLLSDRARPARPQGLSQAAGPVFDKDAFPKLGDDFASCSNSSERLQRVPATNSDVTEMGDNSCFQYAADTQSETDITSGSFPQKTVKKSKKFDFTKANQKLLEDFPIYVKPQNKILTLTQQNLEKFLRESDNESSCSSQGQTSHNSTQEKMEDLPVYQRYAVTLDDIRKSKSSQVPPQVKGYLANLLEAMDAYIQSPDQLETKPREETDGFNVKTNDMMERGDAEAPIQVLNTHVDGECSAVSVVSELSNLSSPSDNMAEDYIVTDTLNGLCDTNDNFEDDLIVIETVEESNKLNNTCVKTVNEGDYGDNDCELNDVERNDITKEINGTAAVAEDDDEEEEEKDGHNNLGENNGLHHIEKDLCTNKATQENGYCVAYDLNPDQERNDYETDSRKNNVINIESYMRKEYDRNGCSDQKDLLSKTKGNLCENGNGSCSIDQLDDIDIKSPRIDALDDEKEAGVFQKVERKKKKSSSKDAKVVKASLHDRKKEATVWRLYGKNVIQVDGLPLKCDITELHSMVMGFGTVVDYQLRHLDAGSSVRFKLHSEDACEFAVQCLDRTECVFPDSDCTLTCFQLQT